MDLADRIIVRTIRNFEDLQRLRASWEGWQIHPNSDFAQYWLVCQLRPEVECPHVTVIERAGQPCALVLARLERTNFTPAIGYLKPFRVRAKVLAVLYQGFLGQVDEGVAEAIVQHMWSLLASKEADVAVFHHLPQQSHLLQALLTHGPNWWCEKKRTWSTHWEMVLPEEVGFLRLKLRSKHRSSIRRKQRELEAAFPGNVSWRWISRFDDLPGLCAQLEMVAARTYQRGLAAGFVDDEEHRRRFALFAARGQLRVQVLEIEGKARAFWIGTVYDGVFHSSATGYDPSLRFYEPGTLVFARMVDELTREGVRRFDFGLGDAPYKRRFGDKSWRETTVRLFAPTPKGFVLRSIQGICAVLDEGGRRLLQKSGMFDQLKTGWRRRLAPAKAEGGEK
jgi:hypothetical protein